MVPLPALVFNNVTNCLRIQCTTGDSTAPEENEEKFVAVMYPAEETEDDIELSGITDPLLRDLVQKIVSKHKLMWAGQLG